MDEAPFYYLVDRCFQAFTEVRKKSDKLGMKIVQKGVWGGARVNESDPNLTSPLPGESALLASFLPRV